MPPAAAEATLARPDRTGRLDARETDALVRLSGDESAVRLGDSVQTLLVLGGFGRYDLFTLVGISGTSGLLRAEVPGGVLLNTYAIGSTVVEVVQRSYLLKTDARGVSQLVMQDGPSGADVPVVDHVVALRFDYLGDPRPSTLLTPITDPMPPWTRYGPKPPAACDDADSLSGGGELPLHHRRRDRVRTRRACPILAAAPPWSR